MNYKIIADQEKLLHFISWLPDLEEHEKYYVALFARKKYAEEGITSSDKTQLKRFTSDKKRLFDKIKQLEVPLGAWKLKSGAAPEKSLALYISLNPRCMKKATELMGKKCWDLMHSKNYNVHAEALSCIHKSKSRTCYVDFDIDDKDIDPDEAWLNTEIGIDNYTILDTRGGYHILVEPEKASYFRQENFNDKNWFQMMQKKYPVDQSGDLLIPVAGTFQGGFIPTFKKKIQ